MRRFYIKISGSAWNIQAETPEEAIKQIIHNLYVYCTISPLEIGVDVDELGYPKPKQTLTQELGLE